MRIVITGGPATGKTEVAKILGKMLQCEVVNEKEFCQKHGIGTLHGDELVVDTGELRRKMEQELGKKDNLIMEGHMISNIKLKADHVFILRTSLGELEKRLSKRFYREQKVWDNVIVEGIDYCKECSYLNYERTKVHEVDTTGKTAREIAERIAQILKGKGKGDSVDWSGEMTKYLSKKPAKK